MKRHHVTRAERDLGTPTIQDLTSELHAEGAYLRREFSAADLCDENDGPHRSRGCTSNHGTDVRLQLRNGRWSLHTGDSSYDQDHRGYWGSSCISRGATWRECRETARALIEEALDDAHEHGACERYHVLVGNVGTVGRYGTLGEARKTFASYVDDSQNSPMARCYGEDVTIIDDREGEIIAEHFGTPSDDC